MPLNFRRASIPKEAHKSQHEAMEMAFYAGGMGMFGSCPGDTDSPDKGDDVSSSITSCANGAGRTVW